MAIYKNKHYENFTQISNDVIRSGLSDKALGALVRLLSHGADWKTSIKSYARERHITEGRASTVFHELMDAGHIEEIKDRNEKGQFIHGYNVYETPQAKKDNHTTSEPEKKTSPVKKGSKRTHSMDNPRPENPCMDNSGGFSLYNNKKRNTKKDLQRESVKTAPDSLSKHKKLFGRYQNVPLTDEEYNNLCDYYGKEEVSRSIDGMSKYIAVSGKEYTNTAIRLEEWIEEDIEKYGSVYDDIAYEMALSKPLPEKDSFLDRINAIINNMKKPKTAEQW